MKQSCEITGMNYEALKFYCNQGLVPGVKRDSNNHRVFDDHAIAWLKGLDCLKRCGLSIKEMQQYTQLCLEGESTIPERKDILAAKRRDLEAKLAEIQDAIDYIDGKQAFYDDVVSGVIPYRSNLINPDSSTEASPNA